MNIAEWRTGSPRTPSLEKLLPPRKENWLEWPPGTNTRLAIPKVFSFLLLRVVRISVSTLQLVKEQEEGMAGERKAA